MARAEKTRARSGCPIASTLDLVGDRWSLVIMRDMFNGKKRFSEFLASPEGITTSILADRLAQLEEAKLIAREAYSMRPPRYDYLLTAAGRAFLPILQDICRWANVHIPGTWVAPPHFMERRVE